MFRYCCKRLFWFKGNNTERQFSNVVYPQNSVDFVTNSYILTLKKYKINPLNEIVYKESNLRELLGEGGTCVVHKYHFNGMDFACKKISRPRSTIEREIKIMSMYKTNKYLVTYFGCHLQDNIQHEPNKHVPIKPSYIFMEYCQGRELFEVLAHNYDYKVILSIIYQLLSALKHLQKYKIVHADIKLENIIINNNNEIKLIDFGLSRVIESGKILQINNHIGTIGYVSPEVMVDNYITIKTDVWSVGVLMYILLNNVHLFDVINRQTYRSQLSNLTHTLSQNGLLIFNHSVPISQHHNIKTFLVKTICYDKNRLTVKKCLKHPIFSEVDPTIRRTSFF